MLRVMRTLVSTMSGSRFRGKVPIADNIEAFLFDKNGQGILVLWDKGNESGVKQLAINLGERPLRMDLWGNVTPLLQGNQTDASRLRLDVGPMPIILFDIDGQ